jgi:hypothetical protein
MSKDTLARIFEPFFSTKGITGTGLELWVTLGIIQKHEGRMKVRSRENPSHHGDGIQLVHSASGTVGAQEKGRVARGLSSIDQTYCLLQFNLADGDVLAIYGSRHIDLDVLGLLHIGDKPLGLGIARRVKLDHFPVVCQHAIAALHAFWHLQALLGMLGPKAGFLSFFTRAGQVYQITLNLGFRGKGAQRRGRKQYQRNSPHDLPCYTWMFAVVLIDNRTAGYM